MVIIGHDEDGRGILHICDYKNGKGVLVDYNHNTQMMLYALGALHLYGKGEVRRLRKHLWAEGVAQQ